MGWAEKAVEVGARLLLTALSPRLTRQVMSQRFAVGGPTVVFVKATQAQVSVRRQPGRVVRLDADLYVSAGLEVATQQDEAGVYIVVLRKRFLGAFSRSDLRLTLPPDCELIADLEHSNLHLNAMSGRAFVPGVRTDFAGKPPAEAAQETAHG
jgi:hypothetical protein